MQLRIVKPYFVLAIGILVASSSSLLIMFALGEGVPAIAIAALRLTMASLALVPFTMTRAHGEWRRLMPNEFALTIASGILLAIHFACWISSLNYTSVMSSIVFVSTAPLFVALVSVLFLHEPLRRGTIVGIAVAAIGGVLVGMIDLGQVNAESLQGDALALGGALAVSGYLLIGRRIRKRLSLLSYISLVYSTAAVVLLVMACVMGVRLTGYSVTGYTLIILLAVGPQLIGHSSYNWALKYLSATFVTITILAEPIVATVLAIHLLSQVPQPIKLLGGVLILVGIYCAARGESQQSGANTIDTAVEI